MQQQPLDWRARGALWVRLGIRGGLVVAAWLLLRHVGPFLLGLLGPFVLALMAAWLLNPPVRWLHRRLSVSRKAISLVLIVLIFCALGGVLYGLGVMAVGQIRSLLDNWPSLLAAMDSTADALADWFSRFQDLLPRGLLSTGEGLMDSLGNWLESLDVAGWVASLAGQAPALVSDVTAFAVSTVVFIMASYLITADYPRLRFLVTDQVPADTRAFGATVKQLFVQAFGGYLKSQLLLSLVVFLILAVGFVLIGQPYGLLLAVLLAVLDFIPIIGAGTVMVPWAAVDLILGSYAHAVQLMVIWGAIALFRRLGEPKILGDQTGLPPILSLVGIYAGMRLGGVLGMIVGPILLLVLLNLGRLGVFAPAVADLRAAARDVLAILQAGQRR
ncbi:MAG TPA: sporulation integral membrane protein YtvI [Firmicutes bacterium]|nr:sporulation integral membrane protein YtvI [Bacillota bacterium]